MLGININIQGFLGIELDSQERVGRKKSFFFTWKLLEEIIPEGTTNIETNQAIMTPIEISSPNSWTILIEVVINAKNPIEVVMLVKNMTLDIWDIVWNIACLGLEGVFEKFSLNLAWMCIASPIPMIKRSVGTIYVMMFISSPAKPIIPRSQITVIRTVSIGKKTYTQFLKTNVKIEINRKAIGGKNRKLSLSI